MMFTSRLMAWSRGKFQLWMTYLPGVLVSATIALAAAFLSEHYGGPLMLYALLLGMAFHFLSEDKPCLPGIDFAARSILRVGVALLGVRITLDQVASLGVSSVVMVVLVVILTIAVGVLLSRCLGLSQQQGLLSAGAVAICGASAALALSSVMPKNQHSERTTLLTVVGVTTLSTVAMVVYPLLVDFIGLDEQAAGVFLGATIHDVAQVVGAGYIISAQTGDVSTVVKLLRVAMLVPVVFCFSMMFRNANDDNERVKTPLLPGFLLVFIMLVVLNSSGVIPTMLVSQLSELSRCALVTAISALGIKTSFRRLAVVGWKPVVLMVGETLFLALLVLAVLSLGWVV